MPYHALDNYLQRLSTSPQAGTRVWLDAEGRAQGRYFNCTLTSAFQPVRILGSTRVAGFEAFARSYSETDPGLSLWRFLDHAADDDESIELDRLCRMLHAINFYRQPEAAHADLYLSVHDRLLAAIDSNHGSAFRRILDGLGLPVKKVILQLPALTHNQGWLLSHVAGNYRRNGFRYALNAAHATEALGLLEGVRPDVIKVDARENIDQAVSLQLLVDAKKLGIRIIFKRLENQQTLEALLHIGAQCDQPIYAQGHLWDLPKPALDGFGLPAVLEESGA